MDTIKKAAEKYSLTKNTKNEIAHTITCEDFKKGVKYATKFISTDEEEPPTDIPLLLKFVNRSYEVGYYLKHKYRGLDFYSYPEPDIEFLFEAVTHWRRIDFK